MKTRTDRTNRPTTKKNARKGRRVAPSWTFIALLTFVFALNVDAAPPTRRVPASEKTQNSVGAPNSGSLSQPPDLDKTLNSAELPNLRPSRSEETNDGALPTAESASLFADVDETNLAERWNDPTQAEILRTKTLDAARRRRENWTKFASVDDARAATLGIRRIEGKNVVLRTDMPASDAVDEIPVALDAAIPQICRFFEIDEKQFENWKIEAFLMADVGAFIQLGVLDGPPKFLYGYSDKDRIFAIDQKIEYYNRFLLLHELVHSFMHEVFGDLRPRWFSEGSAEFLALHRWNSATKSIQIAQFPDDPDATPGFGRLRQIQEIVRDEAPPSLFEILNFEPRDYLRVSTYAWSWAFVSFLNNSPKYREIVRNAPYWANIDDPNGVFCDAIGDHWIELENDWTDFILKIDYLYDFERTAIDATLGRPFAELATADALVVEASPTAGWQNSGVELEANTAYKLTAAGRFNIYVSEIKKRLEFEAPGASFQYVFGAPTGRLFAVVVPREKSATFDEFYRVDAAPRHPGAFRFNAFRNVDRVAPEMPTDSFAPDENGFYPRDPSASPFFPWDAAVPFATNATTLTPTRAGVLFFRINDAPKNLARNSGSVKIQIKRVETKIDAE